MEPEANLFDRIGLEQTVDTDEAATLLGKKPQTLRRWACEGSAPEGLRPRKVLGRLRWSVAEIRALLAGTPSVAA